jgi:hypothetical protein
VNNDQKPVNVQHLRRVRSLFIAMAQKRLMQELQPLQKEKWVNIEV